MRIKNMLTALCLMAAIMIGIFSMNAAPPSKNWAMRFHGAWLTADTNPPIGQSSIYQTSGSTCTSNTGLTNVINDQSWYAVEKSVNSTYMQMRKSPTTGRYNGIAFIKCIVKPHGWNSYYDGWMQFAVVLTEQSRDEAKGTITFTGTWQTLYGEGACEYWSGSGRVTQATATYLIDGIDPNPIVVSFTGDTAPYPGKTTCLELEGTMVQNIPIQ